MWRTHSLHVFHLVAFCGLGVCLFGCDTGVESSPDPGIVRVTLQSDPADTSIVILADTFTVSPGDFFPIIIFQGKVSQQSNFALLFKDTESYRPEDVIYDVLKRENGEYVRFVIYESFVPPGNYDRLQFGATASLLILGNFVIPVQLPPDADQLMDFYYDFEVFESRVTEINVEISPFESVRRFRDSFLFDPKMRIVSVRNF